MNESSLDTLAESVREILGLDNVSEGLGLSRALIECIKEALAVGSVETLVDFFKERCPSIDPKLKSLVGKTIQNFLPNWTQASSSSMLSLPKLVDHNWAVHDQTASSSVSSMQIPSVLVRLKVEEQPSMVGKLPEVQNVDFELSKESLETMLDGFGKIKTQLSNFS
mgnify:FL=1